jgi:hypothetical protein
MKKDEVKARVSQVHIIDVKTGNLSHHVDCILAMGYGPSEINVSTTVHTFIALLYFSKIANHHTPSVDTLSSYVSLDALITASTIPLRRR